VVATAKRPNVITEKIDLRDTLILPSSYVAN
jgi:hypothetical protein